MARQQTKLLIHPDRDQIVSKLVSGETVRSIADWLKNKYPENKDYHISSSALDVFRKEKLNIEGIVLDDIKSKIKEQQYEEFHMDMQKTITRNKTYQEKINEVVDTQIDWKKKLIGIMNAMEGRFEYLYNRMQDDPNNLKADNTFLKYIREVLGIIQEIRKIEGAPDQVIQHNVTVQAVDQHAVIIQEAIKEAISELDIQTASIVLDKIVSKLESLEMKDISLIKEKDFKKVNLLEAELINDEEEGDDE